MAARLPRTSATRGVGGAGTPDAHGTAVRRDGPPVRAPLALLRVDERAGTPRPGDSLWGPSRRGRRCLRLSQRSRAARRRPARRRPVLRGGASLAERGRFFRADRLPAWRGQRDGPDGRARSAAADGVRSNTLGLWPLSRRAVLRRAARARNVVARQTAVRHRPRRIADP